MATISDRTVAEFDDYSAGYSAGMDNPVKRLVGTNPDQFLEVKARWLLRDMESLNLAMSPGPSPHLLDYGCGMGSMMRVLHRLGFSGSMTGCDISAGMLQEAMATWDRPPGTQFYQQEGAATPFADASFDIIIISAVLHHVEPDQRPAVYKELIRLLRPSGRLYIFEHNPWNPVTRYVVAHTPIDQNAILLSFPEAKRSWHLVGGNVRKTAHLMFTPPSWQWMRWVDDLFVWLPMGGQYVVVGEK